MLLCALSLGHHQQRPQQPRLTGQPQAGAPFKKLGGSSIYVPASSPHRTRRLFARQNSMSLEPRRKQKSRSQQRSDPADNAIGIFYRSLESLLRDEYQIHRGQEALLLRCIVFTPRHTSTQINTRACLLQGKKPRARRDGRQNNRRLATMVVAPHGLYRAIILFIG